MPGMHGADVAHLRTLASQFDRAAEQLDCCRTAVGGAVRLSPWRGPDASRFRADWEGAHAGRVTAAAATLRTGAQQLRANAEQQEQASAVDAGAGVPRDSGGGPFTWLGDRADDAWSWLTGRAGAVVDEFGNLVDAGGQLWAATGGSVLTGRWPAPPRWSPP